MQMRFAMSQTIWELVPLRPLYRLPSLLIPVLLSSLSPLSHLPQVKAAFLLALLLSHWPQLCEWLKQKVCRKLPFFLSNVLTRRLHAMPEAAVVTRAILTVHSLRLSHDT